MPFGTSVIDHLYQFEGVRHRPHPDQQRSFSALPTYFQAGPGPAGGQATKASSPTRPSDGPGELSTGATDEVSGLAGFNA